MMALLSSPGGREYRKPANVKVHAHLKASMGLKGSSRRTTCGRELPRLVSACVVELAQRAVPVARGWQAARRLPGGARLGRLLPRRAGPSCTEQPCLLVFLAKLPAGPVSVT